MDFDFISGNFEAERNSALVEKWSRNVEAVRQANEGHYSDLEAVNLATLLENMDREFRVGERKMMLEAPTQASAIGPFKRYAFDILTAVMPTIISNDIVSVQPLKQKLGQVFFLEFLYGTTKGGITQGNTMFSPWQVGTNPTDPNYTSEFVNGEYLGAANGTGNYSGNFAFTPLRSGSINISVTMASGNVTIIDDGQGNLIQQGATPVTVGTVVYASGQYTLALGAATDSPVTANYQYNLEVAPTTIPEVNIQVQEFIIQARARKLKANYAFDAAYDLEISQGINIDDALLQAAASEIRHLTLSCVAA